MINYRVDGLESLVEDLRKTGVPIVDKIETVEYDALYISWIRTATRSSCGSPMISSMIRSSEAEQNSGTIPWFSRKQFFKKNSMRHPSDKTTHTGFVALIFLLLLALPACSQPATSGNGKTAAAQNKTVGGSCEDCQLIYKGMPEHMDHIDTSAAWQEPGPKLLISGTIYKPDGRTPAPGIILYYYHTDQAGHYSKLGDKPENNTRHGHIRGWVKTDEKGAYAIFTNRPASYPNSRIEAHIHVLIKEPGLNEYYVDELVFDDDPMLTADTRRRMEGRGSSGILQVVRSGNLQRAEHNIVLGKNIPGYRE